MSLLYKDKIVEKFGSKCLKRSAANLLNGEEYIRYFMTKKPIKVAVEIGTMRGITTAIMSQYADQVITFDLIKGQLEREAVQFNRPVHPSREEIWDYLGIKNITAYYLHNDIEKRNKLNNLDFDFTFIDGDHIDGFKLDFELCKKCGRVLFHDYEKRPEPQPSYIYNWINENLRNIESRDCFAYWSNNEQ